VAPALPAAPDEDQLAGRIYKAVKVTMITGKMSLLEKFQLAKDVGFEGISLFAPDRFDLKEALDARDKTGLLIHNVNNAVHWNQRLSDPDPKVRSASLAATMDAIRFAHAAGASSILQVVGKVTNPETENHQQVWDRSMAELRKAIPLAARLGVRILCENVGNGFCTDPKQWCDYLDEFASPWVGAFFDIGNHHSYGGADRWVRALGTRIVKLDVKGHDSTRQKNCNILEGDIDWQAVRNELAEIRFTGWATAEVRGGDRARLRQVVQRMDQVLGTRS
jgi:hexulose-6-phosphate isomerase